MRKAILISAAAAVAVLFWRKQKNKSTAGDWKAATDQQTR